MIEPGAIAEAKALAARLALRSVPVPSVVPTVNGTVQLEWHTSFCDAEVEILRTGRYFVFSQPVEGTPWEGETDQDEAVQRLKVVLSD